MNGGSVEGEELEFREMVEVEEVVVDWVGVMVEVRISMGLGGEWVE